MVNLPLPGRGRGDRRLQLRQGCGQLGGPVPACRIGGSQLCPRWVLAAGAHQVIRFDRECEAAQALRGPTGQRAAPRPAPSRPPLETRHRLVDLHAHARPTLLVVRLGLGQDEITGELWRSLREHGPPPIGGMSLTACAGDQQRNQADRQDEDHGQEDPTPGGRARRRLRRSRGRRGGGVRGRGARMGPGRRRRRDGRGRRERSTSSQERWWSWSALSSWWSPEPSSWSCPAPRGGRHEAGHDRCRSNHHERRSQPASLGIHEGSLGTPLDPRRDRGRFPIACLGPEP